MRKIVFLLVVFLAFAKGNSQILDPVKWTTKIEKKSDRNYVLIFNGVIESGWHMYSQFTPDGGPLPLEVIFKDQKGFSQRVFTVLCCFFLLLFFLKIFHIGYCEHCGRMHIPFC